MKRFAIALSLVWAVSGPVQADPPPCPSTAPAGKHPVTFHVDLSAAVPGATYHVQALGKRYELAEHTAKSRRRARREDPSLRALPDERLTHYTKEKVSMPNGGVVRVHVKRTNPAEDADCPTAVDQVSCYVPPTDPRALAVGRHHHPIDYNSTAKCFLFHHLDLISTCPSVANTIFDHMENGQYGPTPISSLIDDMTTLMAQMGPPDEDSGWARMAPMRDLDNCADPKDPTTCQPLRKKATNEVICSITPAQEFVTSQEAGQAMTALLASTKNDVTLSGPGKKWSQQTGTAVKTVDTSTAVQARLPARAEGTACTPVSVAPANDDYVSGLQTSVSATCSDSPDPNTQMIQFELSNNQLRYIEAWVQCFDSLGNAASCTDTNGQPSWQKLVLISPLNTIMAVPANPGTATASLTLPANVVSLKVRGCGLGTGAVENSDALTLPGVMTGVANFAVPTLFLAVQAAAQTYKPLYDIMSDPGFIAIAATVGASFFTIEITSSAAEGQVNWSALSSLGQILFMKGAGKALVWVEEYMAEGAVEDEIPFAGWIMMAVNVATTLAQMAESITAIATSPWCSENLVSLVNQPTITLLPDPRHGAFPQPAAGQTATWVAKLIYQQQGRPTLATQPIPVGTVPRCGSTPCLKATIPGNTLGGQVKLEVDYYIDDWLAGKATTGFMPNTDDYTATPELFLVEFPKPIDSSTRFEHSAILTYPSGAYQWQTSPAPPAPTATIASRNTAATCGSPPKPCNALGNWTNLALSQRHGVLGASWQAGGMGIADCATGATNEQLYTPAYVTIPGISPVDLVFPSCGFSGSSWVVFDPYPPKFEMQNGQWVTVGPCTMFDPNDPNCRPKPDPSDQDLGAYYVDPRKAIDPDTSGASWNNGAGYHLRQMPLDGSPIPVTADLPSYGRFPYSPDSLAIHPAGYVIAINQKYHRVMVSKLPSQGTGDDDLPLARVYGGQALNFSGNDGKRPGLLVQPAGVTVSYDGTILVLDFLSSQSWSVARLQAFDLQGNPVNRFFDATGAPSPYLDLPEKIGADQVTYLDLATVGDQQKSYIFVLYYQGDGSQVADYHVAVYQYGTTKPAGNPLVLTVDGVAAAELAVDIWHTLYTLDFAMTTDGQSHPAGPAGAGTGPAGRTVPAISEWVPIVP